MRVPRVKGVAVTGESAASKICSCYRWEIAASSIPEKLTGSPDLVGADWMSLFSYNMWKI